MSQTSSLHHSPGNPRKRRYAFVGTGGRVKMFLDPVAGRFRENAEIVALCDSSLVRAHYHQQRLAKTCQYGPVPVYPTTEFQQMLQQEKPDEVVVCTIDREHDRYIVDSLHHGCDVITEKPMTIDRDRCRRIMHAVNETGKRVRVAFNYRWAPGASMVKEILKSGTIGRIHQVNMEYLLNTSHGADYFRRWHALKENSGGLLVHKSTHHFDLINWWTDSIPAQVFASGALRFYGLENALQRGDDAYTKYPRYYGFDTKADPFSYDYANPMTQDPTYEKSLYLDAEQETGYIRDQNVFRRGITIEDTMSVQVMYRDGMLLNYSLNAFSPYEGYRVTFAGDRGRLEYSENHGTHLFGAKDIGGVHTHSGEQHLWVYPHFKPGYRVEIPKSAGGHGGGDVLLQEQLFSAQPPLDPLGRSARHEQGAASILIGIAANESMVRNMRIGISDLFDLAPTKTKLSMLQ